MQCKAKLSNLLNKNDKFFPLNETAIQGYLYKIAKNKWTDHLRSSQYKKTAPLVDNFHQAENTDVFDIEKNIEEDNKLITTMEAFSKLGAECKELLTKFYFNKQSLRDIAANLHLGEASARNKKYRCIQKLREIALSPN